MYLLDTNHCSAILNNELKISKKLENFNLKIATCDIVAGELIYMAEKSVQRKENLFSINKFLRNINVLPTNQSVAITYGELKAKLMEKHGPKEKEKKRKYKFKEIGISDNDLWIASIGISHQAIIVSRDKDFTRINEVYSFMLESWIE